MKSLVLKALSTSCLILKHWSTASEGSKDEPRDPCGYIYWAIKVVNRCVGPNPNLVPDPHLATHNLDILVALGRLNGGPRGFRGTEVQMCLAATQCCIHLGPRDEVSWID